MDNYNQYVSVPTNENNYRESESNNDSNRRFFKKITNFLKDKTKLLILIGLCAIVSITFYSVFTDSINKSFFSTNINSSSQIRNNEEVKVGEFYFKNDMNFNSFTNVSRERYDEIKNMNPDFLNYSSWKEDKINDGYNEGFFTKEIYEDEYLSKLKNLIRFEDCVFTPENYDWRVIANPRLEYDGLSGPLLQACPKSEKDKNSVWRLFEIFNLFRTDTDIGYSKINKDDCFYFFNDHFVPDKLLKKIVYSDESGSPLIKCGVDNDFSTKKCPDKMEAKIFCSGGSANPSNNLKFVISKVLEEIFRDKF